MDTSEDSRGLPIIHEFTDTTIGLHSYIVIDSLKNNNSCGGVRISNDLSLEEIKELARAMTLKYSFLKMNIGGAKAGIILPSQCTVQQRTNILDAFGQKAASILKKKIFVPWTDMNSNDDDIARIMKAAGCEFHGISDSAYFTALTVASAIRAACEIKNIEVSTISIIIEGFGTVGMHLASEVAAWGAKIIGVSTMKGALYDSNGLDIQRIIELKKQYNDDFIQYYRSECLMKKELLLEMETDILIPCARTWTINANNMKSIQSKIIIPAANAPLTNEAEKFLHQKGIICLPDFVCNIGGVLGIILYEKRNKIPVIHRFLMIEFGTLIKELLEKSIKDSYLPSDIARAVAEENLRSLGQNKQRKPRVDIVIKRIGKKNIHSLTLLLGIQAWRTIQNQRRILRQNREMIKNQQQTHI